MKKILLLIALISSFSFSAQKSNWVYCCSNLPDGQPIYIDVLNTSYSLLDNDSVRVFVWISNCNDKEPANATFQLLEFKSLVGSRTLNMKVSKIVRLANGETKEHSEKIVWKEFPVNSLPGKIFAIAMKSALDIK